jgi:predicted molibdopterin-dependent oxidoreductase YjgC
MRVEKSSNDLRTGGIGRGAAVPVYVDGEEVQAFEGETVLAVLWASGRHRLHTTARTHEPRGFFCGMGVCFDCLVTIDGIVNLRACLEPVRAGMKVTLQRDAGYIHAG